MIWDVISRLFIFREREGESEVVEVEEKKTYLECKELL